MIALPVRPALALKAWPMIEPWVRAALDAGAAHQSPAEIRRHLAGSTMHLWLAWDGKRAHGCAITEVYESARGKTCGLVVVAGLNFKAWRPLTETIKAWARRQDCVRLEAAGRAGWQRYVRADGWRRVRTVIEMDLRAKEHGKFEPDHTILDRPVGADAGAAQANHPGD